MQDLREHSAKGPEARAWQTMGRALTLCLNISYVLFRNSNSIIVLPDISIYFFIKAYILCDHYYYWIFIGIGRILILFLVLIFLLHFMNLDLITNQ